MEIPGGGGKWVFICISYLVTSSYALDAVVVLIGQIVNIYIIWSNAILGADVLNIRIIVR